MPAAAASSAHNGVPMNVELCDALKHIAWKDGIKVAYLYCIGVRALHEHVHPRMALSADDYVMYAAGGGRGRLFAAPCEIASLHSDLPRG